MPLLSRVVGRVASAEAYVARVMAKGTRVGANGRSDPRVLVARIEHGRWLTDCPHCRAGIALHPEWDVAPCQGDGCFRIFAHILVPAEWREIEAILSERPLINQNWVPGESLEILEAANEAHGIAVPKRGRG